MALAHALCQDRRMLFAGRSTRSVGDRHGDGSRLSKAVGPESGGVKSPRSDFLAIRPPTHHTSDTLISCLLCPEATCVPVNKTAGVPMFMELTCQ